MPDPSLDCDPASVPLQPDRRTPDRAEHDAQIQDALQDLSDEKAELASLLKELPKALESAPYSDRLLHMPDGDKDLGWQGCLKLIERHDRDLCQAYREQIDTLLVFAGLFSAVVTAFAVESYQWLQEDPAEISAELMRNMLGLLAQNSNVSISPITSTAASISDRAAARINVYWFLSLTLSLSAALVAILTKQWLREFERDVGKSPETALAVRHIRYQGLEHWKVGTIITSVPLMLQLALALFLTGTVDLLWQLHSAVACSVTVVAGLTLAFYVATTILPLAQYARICQTFIGRRACAPEYLASKSFAQAQCAFKSTQAWLAMRVALPAIDYVLRRYALYFRSPDQREPLALLLRPSDSWVTFDINWMKRIDFLHIGPTCAFQTLSWVAESLEEIHLSSWVWHCVWARWTRNRDTLNATELVYRDIQCVARAYPHVSEPDPDNWTPTRVRGLVFRCTLRTDLPVNTALELILRSITDVGASSPWTREALDAVVTLHRGLIINLTDDISMRLVLHLAQGLSFAITQSPIPPDSNASHDSPYPLDGAAAFYNVVQLITAGSKMRRRLIPLCAAFALRWLRFQPFSQFSDAAGGVAAYISTHHERLEYRPDRLRESPGVIFAARYCRLVEDLWPGFADYIQEHFPARRAIFWGLVEIASVGRSNDTSAVAAPAQNSGGLSRATDRELLRDTGSASHTAPSCVVLGDRATAGDSVTERIHVAVPVGGAVEV